MPRGDLSATVETAVYGNLVMVGKAGARHKIGAVSELIGNGDKELLQGTLIGVSGLREPAGDELAAVPVGNGLFSGFLVSGLET